MKITEYLNNPKYYIRMLIKKIKIILSKPLICLGFMHFRHPIIHGPKDNLILKNKKNVSLVNTIFNTSSGKIVIGDGVLFGHNCMVLTGKHNFESKDVKKIWGCQEKGRDIEI